jgi:hypothetical protein
MSKIGVVKNAVGFNPVLTKTPDVDVHPFAFVTINLTLKVPVSV